MRARGRRSDKRTTDAKAALPTIAQPSLLDYANDMSTRPAVTFLAAATGAILLATAFILRQRRRNLKPAKTISDKANVTVSPPPPPPPPPTKRRANLEDRMLHDDGLTVKPIGTVRSIYRLCVGTPRQGGLAPHARGRLELTLPKDAVKGLDGFSHVWIVFVFHLNTVGRHVPSKVAPPALGGKKVGMLATRTPHRFNPIGMTLCRLDSISFPSASTITLEVSGLDLVDGTPILDIKPYVPHYDSVASTDALQLPPWVSGGLATRRDVHLLPTALSELDTILKKNPEALEFYGTHRGDASVEIAMDTLANCIGEVLSVDVRSAWQTKKAREGKSQAERAERIQQSQPNLVLVEISNSDECTQQLDNLLIHYRIEAPEQHHRNASEGSGAEDIVFVHSIELLGGSQETTLTERSCESARGEVQHERKISGHALPTAVKASNENNVGGIKVAVLEPDVESDMTTLNASLTVSVRTESLAADKGHSDSQAATGDTSQVILPMPDVNSITNASDDSSAVGEIGTTSKPDGDPVAMAFYAPVSVDVSPHPDESQLNPGTSIGEAHEATAPVGDIGYNMTALTTPIIAAVPNSPSAKIVDKSATRRGVEGNWMVLNPDFTLTTSDGSLTSGILPESSATESTQVERKSNVQVADGSWSHAASNTPYSVPSISSTTASRTLHVNSDAPRNNPATKLCLLEGKASSTLTVDSDATPHDNTRSSFDAVPTDGDYKTLKNYWAQAASKNTPMGLVPGQKQRSTKKYFVFSDKPVTIKPTSGEQRETNVTTVLPDDESVENKGDEKSRTEESLPYAPDKSTPMPEIESDVCPAIIEIHCKDSEGRKEGEEGPVDHEESRELLRVSNSKTDLDPNIEKLLPDRSEGGNGDEQLGIKEGPADPGNDAAGELSCKGGTGLETEVEELRNRESFHSNADEKALGDEECLVDGGNGATGVLSPCYNDEVENCHDRMKPRSDKWAYINGDDEIRGHVEGPADVSYAVTRESLLSEKSGSSECLYGENVLHNPLGSENEPAGGEEKLRDLAGPTDANNATGEWSPMPKGESNGGPDVNELFRNVWDDRKNLADEEDPTDVMNYASGDPSPIPEVETDLDYDITKPLPDESDDGKEEEDEEDLADATNDAGGVSSCPEGKPGHRPDIKSHSHDESDDGMLRDEEGPIDAGTVGTGKLSPAPNVASDPCPVGSKLSRDELESGKWEGSS